MLVSSSSFWSVPGILVLCGQAAIRALLTRHTRLGGYTTPRSAATPFSRVHHLLRSSIDFYVATLLKSTGSLPFNASRTCGRRRCRPCGAAAPHTTATGPGVHIPRRTVSCCKPGIAVDKAELKEGAVFLQLVTTGALHRVHEECRLLSRDSTISKDGRQTFRAESSAGA